MSSNAIVDVRNVGKEFGTALAPAKRLWQSLPGAAPTGHRNAVLSDISFGVRKGEFLGIWGRGGAGKSTLLKIISGIMTPTTGQVIRTADVTPLLNLASGFHPDFSGRDNVFLRGALLGKTKEEIEELIEPIAQFSDVGSAFDHAVKTYPGKLRSQLAYASAVLMEPELLVVDDSLVTGDQYFRSKCYEQLEDLRSKGCTLIAATQSDNQIERICDRTILLKDGCVVWQGLPEELSDQIGQRVSSQPIETASPSFRDDTSGPTAIQRDSNIHFCFLNACINDEAGNRVHRLKSGSNYKILAQINGRNLSQHTTIGVFLFSEDGDKIGGGRFTFDDLSLAAQDLAEEVSIEFEFSCYLVKTRFRVLLTAVDESMGSRNVLARLKCPDVYSVDGADHAKAVGPVNLNIKGVILKPSSDVGDRTGSNGHAGAKRRASSV